MQIDSSVVSTARKGLAISGGATSETRVDIAGLAALPSLLGNSDPLHFAQMLPSMQSSSELDAGVHIQGCDHQHNLIALDGVPVYGATHLLGIFSVFNPSHFHSMDYGTTASGVNRLGGILDMHTQRALPRKMSTEASLGLVSAQVTLKLPLGEKAAVIASGRKSLVGLLYGNAMKLDEVTLGYDFSDLNVTAMWQPSVQDRIWADFYCGGDAAASNLTGSGSGLDLGWKNLLGAIHWQHAELDQSLYYSGFSLDSRFFEQNRSVSMPSGIGTLGYKASWNRGRLSLAADAAMHTILPQDPSATGMGISYTPQERMRAVESGIEAFWRGIVGYGFDYEAGLGVQWFLSAEGHSYWGMSPQFTGTWHLRDRDRLQLRGGVWHQYLFQTGISNLGLPTEFWLPAGKYSDPQWSSGASLSYDREFSEGMFLLSGELYWRHLGNQLEYTGGLTELMNGSYRLEEALQKGSGRAWGLNLMLRKQEGRLTGWASLSAGRSLRSFNGNTWPSNHERLVEADLVASYRVGKWDFGGTAVAAGGTPFTEVQEYYLVGSQLVSVFKGHNSSRLKPYLRVDLSARLRFADRERFSHGLTFCVYNATARRQEVFRTIKQHRDGTYHYQSIYLDVTVIPSVGYYIKF